ncbi:MAG: hypothetical protein LQ338_005816 [Usnochroma carphineum]|nr:MAG: hypothetical protein LQ338_005816 [Usnochroma carphineum]
MRRRGRPPGSTNRSHSNPRAAQQTLAFGRGNKITKPSLPPPASSHKSAKRAEKQVKDIATEVDEVIDVPASAKAEEEEEEEEDGGRKEDDVVVVEEDPTLAEGRETALSIREQQREVRTPQVDPAEEKARKVPEAAVKRYWREKEAERKAPRVHQQHLSLHEKILRHFDLSSQYGPCVGVSRARRWKRAEGLGLKPPIEVLAVLVREREREEGKGGGMERAFMDGLLGGSSVVG